MKNVYFNCNRYSNRIVISINKCKLNIKSFTNKITNVGTYCQFNPIGL